MARRIYFQPRHHPTVSETPWEDHLAAVQGYQLEQARAADTAWRARQAHQYQKWIDRAHAWEREGRRWVHTPGEGVGHALIGIIVTGASAIPHARLLPFLAVLFGLLILLHPLLGVCLHALARLTRGFWLYTARRANVAVLDPGNVPLLQAALPSSPEAPHSLPPGSAPANHSQASDEDPVRKRTEA